MGFVADMPNCQLDLESDPKILKGLKPDVRPASNLVTLPLSSFKARFAFNYEASNDPKQQNGKCRIGLVQNVLYENTTFTYQGGRPRSLPYENNIVDCGASEAFPFHNVPGQVVRGGKTESMVPFLAVTYNQYGFTGAESGRTDRWWQVNFIDQPHVMIKLRNSARKVLSEVTRILVFQVWLVVIPSDQQQAQVLAHSEPFSLLYKCWMSTRGELLTTGTPDYLFRTAATKGIKRGESGFANLFGVGTVPGQGPTAPVLKGADQVKERDDAWAKLLLTI